MWERVPSKSNPWLDVEVLSEGDKFRLARRVPCGCDCPNCTATVVKVLDSPVFDDEDEALDWIEHSIQSWEEYYDDYLERNSYQIRQSEMYEMWRNEY